MARTTDEFGEPQKAPKKNRRRPASVIVTEELLGRLEDEVERTARNGGSLGVLVIHIEEPAGHPEPLLDEIRWALRQVDFVGLLGTHYILAVLPDTAQGAHIPATRLLELLGNSKLDCRIGVAVCPLDASRAGELIKGAQLAADNAPLNSIATVPQSASQFQVGRWTLVAAEPAMQKIVALVRQLARSPLPVLLTGETGVGKEIFAEVIHHWSDRSDGPMVTINCAAVTASLFESELFGHERGAFTGATETKQGLLEAANGGTVLLDEIGECPPAIQAMLLRILETKRVCRVGSVVERPVDIRVLAATNRDLEQDVAQGTFRKDLFFRLNAATVCVPPLRDRPLDLPLLAQIILENATRIQKRGRVSLSPSAIRRLAAHEWSGNVRELRNVLEFCLATSTGSTIEAESLPPNVAGTTAPWLVPKQTPAAHVHGSIDLEDFRKRPFQSLKEELRLLERTRMVQALEVTSGVQTKAAELLEMPLRTFVKRLDEYQLRTESGKTDDEESR